MAESVTWQSQSRGHRSNPAQIVCKSKQLDPKHLREASADSRPDQDKAAALLCPSSLPPAISCCCINIIISPFPQSGADLLRSERFYAREEVASTSHAMAIANPNPLPEWPLSQLSSSLQNLNIYCARFYT